MRLRLGVIVTLDKPKMLNKQRRREGIEAGQTLDVRKASFREAFLLGGRPVRHH